MVAAARMAALLAVVATVVAGTVVEVVNMVALTVEA